MCKKKQQLKKQNLFKKQLLKKCKYDCNEHNSLTSKHEINLDGLTCNSNPSMNIGIDFCK